MPANAPVHSRATVNRLIHAALALGVTLMTIVIVVLRQTGQWSAPSQSPTVGFALAGAGAVMIALALAILRPRIASRGSNESPDEFWNAARGTTALVTWATIEAGALLAAVGYALTGLWTPFGVVPIGLIAFLLTRPGALERAA